MCIRDSLIGQLKQPPKRTIRVVAFANEEQGLYGGKAYAAKYCLLYTSRCV